jgi:type II secretory pathway component PulM
MLRLGLWVVAAMIFWQYLWDPLTDRHARLREALPIAREEAARFAAEASGLERLPANAVTQRRGTGRSPQAAIEASAARALPGSEPARVESAPGDRLLVRISLVPFQSLIRWIAGLAANDGFRVEALQISAAGEGKVKVERLLLAPASLARPGAGSSASGSSASGSSPTSATTTGGR